MIKFNGNEYKFKGIKSVKFNGNDYQKTGTPRFVMVGSQGATYYTLDGTNFTAMTGIASTDTIYSVAYGNNRYVCVCVDASNNPVSYVSTNGTSWTSITGLTKNMFGICYGNGMFVAVGEKMTAILVDGSNTWVENTTTYFGSNSFSAVCYSGTSFIAVGSGIAYFSSDALNWYSYSSGISSNSHLCVKYFGNILWSGGTYIIDYRLSTGSWVSASGLSSSTIVYGLACNSSKMVAVTDKQIYYADKGDTDVTRITGSTQSKALRAVEYGMNMFLAVGISGIICTSRYGNYGWTVVKEPNVLTTNNFLSICFGEV